MQIIKSQRIEREIPLRCKRMMREMLTCVHPCLLCGFLRSITNVCVTTKVLAQKRERRA